jgi:hypothetical protein
MEQVKWNYQAKEQPDITEFPDKFIERFGGLAEIMYKNDFINSLSKVNVYHSIAILLSLAVKVILVHIHGVI